MKVFLNYTDTKRLFRVNFSSKMTIHNIRSKILKVAQKKNIKIDTKSVRIRHLNKYMGLNTKLNSTLNISNNDTIYISSSKLKGGYGGSIGLPVIFYSVPVWSVFISICALSVVCPIVYIILLYGGSYKAQDIYNLIYDNGSLKQYNNYYIRQLLDDPAYIDLINEKYYIFKYLKDCKFTLFKSHLYMFFYFLYAMFIVFTSNLYFITLFMSQFSDNGYKCFVHSSVHPIHGLVISICVVVPIVLLILGRIRFKLSIFTYMLTLLVGIVCILTSVYWNPFQNYKDALKYRDASFDTKNNPYKLILPNNSINYYETHKSDFQYMPNYFRFLYYIPFIIVAILIICKLLHVHPLLWGVIISFLCSLPSYYILQNEIPLYCNNTFVYSKSFEQILKTLNANPGLYSNLEAPDNITGQPEHYYNIFR